jgi:membrane protease subunit (stomatin/prohibitin family)
MAVGQAMAQGMGGAFAQQPGAPAAPVAAAPDSIEDRLGKLKALLDRGLISAADYDSTKAELLKKLIG